MGARAGTVTAVWDRDRPGVSTPLLPVSSLSPDDPEPPTPQTLGSTSRTTCPSCPRELPRDHRNRLRDVYRDRNPRGSWFNSPRGTPVATGSEVYLKCDRRRTDPFYSSFTPSLRNPPHKDFPVVTIRRDSETRTPGPSPVLDDPGESPFRGHCFGLVISTGGVRRTTGVTVYRRTTGPVTPTQK